MIVERWTWQVKPARQSEFIELVKATVEALGLTPRVCSYRFGAVDTVSSDLEFETFLDRTEWWDNYDPSLPEVVEWYEKYPDLTELGRTMELLIVH